MGCIKSVEFVDGPKHEAFKLLKKQDHAEFPTVSAYMGNNSGGNYQRISGIVLMKVFKKDAEHMQDISKIMQDLLEVERLVYDRILQHLESTSQIH